MATPSTTASTASTGASKTSSYSSTQTQQPQQRPHGGARARKVSEFGRQLKEKQKARLEYGLRERQFANYFRKAARSSIATGQALFTALELRLDNVVYRSGVAKTRRMARQLVGHGLVLVNGKTVDTPSYSVNAGDTITLKKHDFLEYNKEVIIPNWLSFSQKTMTATVERIPKADDIQTDLNSQLIIEYYSR
jgi:small subunit ribosomal protein S4